MDTAPAKPVDPTPEAAFEILEHVRSGNTAIGIRVAAKGGRIDSFGGDAVGRAREALSKARATFLQSAVVQELNGLRDRFGKAHSNLADTKARITDSRVERNAAITRGHDDLLDALDAKIEAAEADAVRYGDRIKDIANLIGPVETRAKEGLAVAIEEAATGYVSATIAARDAAVRQLTLAMSTPLTELCRADEDLTAAILARRNMLNEYAANV